ncbi:uncharacterized protein HMPREF1541_03100 [Cyphellophora europaea CBS 101466]|uniref:RAVE complex protein Rav1 C-terminal domain-containing protein n=1 Tax=Cyphellophora europaea (strain CBS 101466) TaxID=1220924 RepID=W2RXW3_CYPE1|nr:uncharacterized protein HMPREF1541_03100 [Cyphellophora europaea CBS 101466]ETN41165.1 hypothetical protein HMPREF1541_03100 [Cyphellophora europaea CBS 101466]
MPTILPGRPHAGRQAISTAYWNGIRLTAYVSRSAIVITTDLYSILQTIHLDCEPLHAVAIEEFSGRIAACNSTTAYVYEPVGKGTLKWESLGPDGGVLSTSLRSTNGAMNGDDTQVNGRHSNPELRRASIPTIETINSLSWASAEELLLAGSRMQLWFVAYDSRVVWDQELPYPVALAYCSHDAGLIASCGQHDRLVKIWRRLAYESDSTRFDVSYLPHPSSVTNMHWRKPWHQEQNLDNLLYTFCADGYVRVWAQLEPHSATVMQKVAAIDTNTTIQPRRLSQGSISKRRYAFILDSRDFSHATERAVENTTSTKADHALEHLIEIANRSPEICVVLDGLGHMSAWGLENAGCKNKAPAEVFNVAHVDNVDLSLLEKAHLDGEHVQFCTFAGGNAPSSISLLVHSFDGTVSHYEAHIAGLFDTATRRERLQQSASWAGHEEPVNGIIHNKAGDQLLTWTIRDANIFSIEDVDDGNVLTIQTSRTFDSDILDICYAEDYAIVLLHDSLQLLPGRDAIPLRKRQKPVRLKPLDSGSSEREGHFAIEYANDDVEVWIPQPPSNNDLDKAFAPAAVDQAGHQYLFALFSSLSSPLAWHAILSASHSTSQDILTTLTHDYYGGVGRLTWPRARACGLLMWLSEREALLEQTENVARAEFTKREDRNPVESSLLYFALGKKTVVQGLWRTAIGVRERDNTMKLLANNFAEPRWRQTALKNAYALLSKRRFEYGAAWFVLAGNLKAAVNVCVNQVRDLQLAIVISRVYHHHPDGEKMLRELLEATVLPKPAEDDEAEGDDEALKTWAQEMLAGLRVLERGESDSDSEEEKDGVGREIRNEDEAQLGVAPKKKPPPTQFAEPSGDSLLDSFGF